MDINFNARLKQDSPTAQALSRSRIVALSLPLSLKLPFSVPEIVASFIKRERLKSSYNGCQSSEKADRISTGKLLRFISFPFFLNLLNILNVRIRRSKPELEQGPSIYWQWEEGKVFTLNLDTFVERLNELDLDLYASCPTRTTLLRINANYRHNSVMIFERSLKMKAILQCKALKFLNFIFF